MSTVPGRLNWPFAATWAACTFIGWLLSIGLTSTAPVAASLLLAGIFAQIVTLALRWRLMPPEPRTASLRFPPPAGQLLEEHSSQQPTTDTTQANWLALAAANDHELTWVLCWVSQLHVLGIMLLGPGVLSALTLGLMMSISEILLLRFAPMKWNEHLPAWWPTALRPARDQHPSLFESTIDWSDKENGESEFESDFPSGELDELDESDELDDSDESEFESEKISATFHGQTEEGESYLQGWQRYEMAAGQKSIAVTIGFFPPFLSPPGCELDHEGDEAVSYEIEHITPAGMRVNMKRRHASDPTSGKLLWHCNSMALPQPKI